MKKNRINIEELRKTAKKLETKNRVTGTLSDNQVDLIIEKVIEKLNFNNTVPVMDEYQKTQTALILMTIILQKGGTNRISGSPILAEIERKTLTSQQLTDIVKSVEKRATMRQLARTLATEIGTISEELNIPGDLANQMRVDVSNLSSEEAAWCSNFQTQNPDCPETVRHWLVQNYKERFKN